MAHFSPTGSGRTTNNLYLVPNSSGVRMQQVLWERHRWFGVIQRSSSCLVHHTKNPSVLTAIECRPNHATHDWTVSTQRNPANWRQLSADWFCYLKFCYLRFCYSRVCYSRVCYSRSNSYRTEDPSKQKAIECRPISATYNWTVVTQRTPANWGTIEPSRMIRTCPSKKSPYSESISTIYYRIFMLLVRKSTYSLFAFDALAL